MDEFEDYFSSIYENRWPSLLTALKSAEKQIVRPNLFSSNYKNEEAKLFSGGEITRGENQLLDFYVMDPASIFAAKLLDVQSGDHVLDMCAAPGGKTLILIEALKEQGELIANEMSKARREKLTKVIQQYVSREVRPRVRVAGKDGGLFALSHPQQFERVLVDAPCSGERHLLQNSKELSEWSPSRAKKLAQRQYALLTAALICCKPGGAIVYSTCSINPEENDKVIEKLLHKKSDQFVVEKISNFPFEAEVTTHGIQFLPDRCGYGPIFCSKLKKLETSDSAMNQM